MHQFGHSLVPFDIDENHACRPKARKCYDCKPQAAANKSQVDFGFAHLISAVEAGVNCKQHGTGHQKSWPSS